MSTTHPNNTVYKEENKNNWKIRKTFREEGYKPYHREELKCYRCGTPGHFRANCPNKNNSGQTRNNNERSIINHRHEWIPPNTQTGQKTNQRQTTQTQTNHTQTSQKPTPTEQKNLN